MNNGEFEFTAAAIISSIWETPPVSIQPSIRLARWSVKETETGDRHFIGFNIDDHEGRASTAIRSFNPKTALGITASGRIYQLAGPPGRDPDADWVWTRWATARKIVWRDVTAEFIDGFGFRPEEVGSAFD